MCCSTLRESERAGGRRPLLLAVFIEAYDGLRGGRGGTLTDLIAGGDSRLISGVGELELIRPFHAFVFRTLPLLVTCLPFVCLPSWRRGCANVPSSTTQSFKSIKDDLRPRFGGDGDGEPEIG